MIQCEFCGLSLADSDDFVAREDRRGNVQYRHRHQADCPVWARKAQRKRAPSKRVNRTKAGPVTVTRADGSTEVRPAYDAKTFRGVVEKGRKQPRTWDEINSHAGGGKDFGP